MRAIRNRPHRYPHGDVLIWKTGDTREISSFHRLAILPKIILAIAKRTVRRVKIDAHCLPQKLAPRCRVRCLRFVAPCHEIERSVGVIQRHVDVRHVVEIIRRNQGGGRCNKHTGSHVIIGRCVHDRTTNRGVAKAVSRAFNVQAWCFVGGRAGPRRLSHTGAGNASGHHVGRMQARAVRGVNRAFENLRPVAGDDRLGNRHQRVGCRCPCGRCKWGHAGRAVIMPHVRPDKARPFLHRIGCVLHRLRGWLRHHVDDAPLHIHLPAVVEAAQSAVFVTTKHQ